MTIIYAFRADNKGSVQIQRHLALIALHRTPENSVAALGAYIAGLFVLNPFFGTEGSAIRDSPKNNLLADGHGKIVDVATRELIALMTPGVPSLLCATSDLTLAAMHEQIIG